MTPDQLIRGRGLAVDILGRKLVHDIDFEIRRQRIFTVIGPNGAGKTTLVRLALGLIAPTRGMIERTPSLRIGYMPQRLSLSTGMPLSVKRFLTLAHRDIEHLRRDVGELGIEHLLDRPMQGLSGGETQRVLLARALLGDPELLVLDEPVQGADVNGQAELYRLIMRLRDQSGCAVLMVSHDLHLVMAATDEVLCINQHVCCSGHPDQVSRDPAYLELFGASDADALAVYSHHHDHVHDLHGNVVTGDERPRHG